MDPIDSMQDQRLANIQKQLQELGTAEVSRDDVWFQNLLCALLKSALMDYQSVVRGAVEYVPLAAWGRRNLLEDKVITEYVLESDDNARSFQADLAADAREMHEAFSDHHRAMHKRMLAELDDCSATLPEPYGRAFKEHTKRETERGPDTSGTDSEADIFRQLLTEMGVDEKRKPMMTSGNKGIAHHIGQLDAFNPMFKICSKLMHRTTLSIAAENTSRGLDAVVPILKDSAFADLVTISNLIKTHVDTVGLRPVKSK